MFVESDERCKLKSNNEESYSNNTFKVSSWKKSSFMAAHFITLFITIILIYFSFSNKFSNNLYIFIVICKVVKIIYEKFIDYLLDDMALRTGISCYINLGLFLCTMGANNFLEFLLSYFIDVGMSIGERLYIERSLDSIIDYIVDYI